MRSEKGREGKGREVKETKGREGKEKERTARKENEEKRKGSKKFEEKTGEQGAKAISGVRARKSDSTHSTAAQPTDEHYMVIVLTSCSYVRKWLLLLQLSLLRYEEYNGIEAVSNT
jgi:hypothetical protein